MALKKQKFKVLRLIICLAVLVTASTLFTTLEPSASENTPSTVSLQAHGAPAIETPALMHRAACSVQAKPQSVYQTQIAKAIASLPKESDKTPEANLASAGGDLLEAYSEDAVAGDTDTQDAAASESEDTNVSENDVVVPPVQEPTQSNTPADDAADWQAPADDPVEDEIVEEDPVEETTSPGGYSDLDYLAAICQIEAGYNYDGCLAVANVILNRVNAGFGSSIYEVIYAPYQFATGQMDSLLSGGTSSVAREAAAAALAGSNNVGSYLFFNGTSWLDPSTLDCPYIVIGGNCFY